MGGGVGLQVAGDRVLGRVGVGRGGKRHAGQGVVLGGGEQGQGVPAGPPDVPDLGASVQHRKPQALPGQVPAHGQAGLASAGHDDVQ